jgi:hypothetical protein
VENILSIEFGPIVQKWEFKIDYEKKTIRLTGTALAKVDISKFNFYQPFGITQLVYVILDLIYRISMESTTCLKI